MRGQDDMSVLCSTETESGRVVLVYTIRTRQKRDPSGRFTIPARRGVLALAV
jgi:hypothetical protein